MNVRTEADVQDKSTDVSISGSFNLNVFLSQNRFYPISHPQGRPARSQFSICCVEGHIAPTDRQRQSARDEQEGSELLGDVERANSEDAELDATLEAGASDTILLKVKTPHTREMFAVVDEFSTAARDRLLQNDLCERDRSSGWMRMFARVTDVVM
ncbi:hypothetical protein BLNAU_22128 [Blattamonas nauphoetae]|uniref:Uncharacterized protein n=1 Tax=Blattamonas nauphoetae TaxID=2049346 RepID=A0ABQ9WV01_9EUKA|nr:hypothetical protein BLNAU_22128 [Blattamonas nauphoetae]